MATPRDRGRTRAETETDILPRAEVAETIGRLRAIASEAGDHLLLGDRPPHPDHKLLDLCADALHWRRKHDEAGRAFQAARNTAFAACTAEGRNFTNAENATCDAAQATSAAHEKSMLRILFEAKQLRATTPAGIYAKALIVRSTKTGAAQMAMSLADDLIACPGLRESLWPAALEVV